MKFDKFSPEKPGELVSIHIRREDESHPYYAFVPSPLPPAWEFPAALWPALAEAKQQIGILEGIGRNLPSPEILLRPIADREALKSSMLEGTYSTAFELFLYELQLNVSSMSRDSKNEQREVSNYRTALNHGAKSDLPLSLRLIREMHSILLTDVRGRSRSPGEFRTQQVAIGSSYRFIPPPPERVLGCLETMERYMHSTESNYDPLVECFLVHYQFETIHPFSDGNGRVGRLLLALMMYDRCGMSKPWLYLSEYFERYRDEYIDKLFNVSAVGDWTSWVEFCITATTTQAKETIVRCEKLLSLRDAFSKRLTEAGGSYRLTQIVESIFHTPFVRIADLSKSLNVAYQTAKSDVERLASVGILQKLEKISPATYFAPEIFAIAYHDLG